MVIRMYFEEDKDLVQRAIDLLIDSVFGHWKIKPSIEIDEKSSYDEEVCVKVDIIDPNRSIDYNNQLDSACNITNAFIIGYVEGFKSK